MTRRSVSTPPSDPSSSDPASPGESGDGAPEAPVTQPDVGAPTGEEAELLRQMLAVEVAARELYELASAAGAAAGEPDVIAVIATDHDAYAESLAGLIGVSARDSIDQELLDERRGDFETDDVGALGDAAYVLESELVATYADVLGMLRNVDAAELVASIMIVESRHCVIAADLSGRGNDLVALLTNDADPLSVSADSEERS